MKIRIQLNGKAKKHVYVYVKLNISDYFLYNDNARMILEIFEERLCILGSCFAMDKHIIISSFLKDF